MESTIKILKKYYFILILFSIIMMRLGVFDIWMLENLTVRVISIPIMALLIYLALSDFLENEDMSFRRMRWMVFDVAMILLSMFSVLQTLYLLIKPIIN